MLIGACNLDEMGNLGLQVGVHPKVKGVQYSTVERAFVIKYGKHISAPNHPRLRRATCSTSCPCVSDADWCVCTRMLRPIRIFRHNNSDTLIYFGIVDILTPYSFKKFVEKSWFHRVRRVSNSSTPSIACLIQPHAVLARPSPGGVAHRVSGPVSVLRLGHPGGTVRPLAYHTHRGHPRPCYLSISPHLNHASSRSQVLRVNASCTDPGAYANFDIILDFYHPYFHRHYTKLPLMRHALLSARAYRMRTRFILRLQPIIINSINSINSDVVPD